MNAKQVIIEIQNPKPKQKIEGGRRDIKYGEKWNNNKM
jgi:hypothetical protein